MTRKATTTSKAELAQGNLRRQAAPLRRAHHAAARFRKDESGSLIIFSLFIFVLILMTGGMAVDIMRYESARTNVQNTIDRAVLAAADLDQVSDAEAVVDDYFAKAGLGHLDPQTQDLTDDLTYSTVTTTVDAKVDTIFMKNLGIEYLGANSGSVAEERVSEIEIALVLDVSGSMGSNSRLTNMKIAAKDFVDTVFENAEDGTMAVSLVPYSTQVNAGPGIMTRLERRNAQPYLYCATFEDDDFTTTTVPPVGNVLNESIIQTSHVDMQTIYKKSGNSGRYWNSSQMNCSTQAALEILPLADDPSVIKPRIESLSAGGWTSIDLGIKWGVAMLDPSLQSVVSGLIADGAIDAAHQGKPAKYTGNQTMKVLVVMTDGANTRQYWLPEELGSGPSNVWINPDNNRLYVFKNSTSCNNDLNRNNCWYSAYNGNYYRTTDLIDAFVSPGDRAGIDDLSDFQAHSSLNRFGYVDLWHTYTENYIAYLYGKIGVNGWDYYSWDEYMYNYYDQPKKDARMKAICDAAKDTGKIVIFTIGFEVSDSDATVMEYCASSESHFHRVAGTQLQTAFAEIANKISQLRLVQ